MDEEADLALLDQHLLKTNQLGQRMTNILGQLDTRLFRLDKAIGPLGLQPLMKKDANIDALLRFVSGKPLTPTQSTAPSRVGTPTDDNAILMRGPDIMALGEYFTTFDAVVDDLERMHKGLMEGRGGAREAGVKDLSHLAESAFQKMSQLFLRISKDGLGRTFDAETLLSSGPPTPPNLFPPLAALLPLTTKLTSILNPVNSTPKTAQVIQPVWDDTVTKFASLRGDWMRRSLSGLVSKVDEADEGGIWQGNGGREKVASITELWNAIMLAGEAETMLITTLFPSHPPTALLTQTLSHPIELANRTLSPTITTLKKNLSQHTFTALNLYWSLSKLQPRWEYTMTACLSRTGTPSSLETKDLVTTLNQPVSALRSLSLRSFPESLADIRSARIDGQTTSSISDVAYSTISYLESLMECEEVVEELLAKSNSERSWLMGLGDVPSSVKNSEEEGGIVKFFVADVLGTLLIHLDSRAKKMKRPIGQAFMLNNASHIRTMLVIQSNSDITGPGAESMLNKAVRDARSQFIAEFQTLITLLSSAPQHHNQRFGVPQLPTSERQHLKESSIAFFEKLSELEATMNKFPLNRQDPEMRDSVAKEAETVVKRGYSGFVVRCQAKTAEKYLRGSVDDIGKRVLAMFR